MLTTQEHLGKEVEVNQLQVESEVLLKTCSKSGIKYLNTILHPDIFCALS